MADGWDVDVSGYQQAQAAIADVAEQWDADATYVVATNVSYAKFVEFGTSKMAAQPYLRPSVRKVAREDLQKYAKQADSGNEFLKLLALAVEREAKRIVPVRTGNLRASITARRVA